MKHSLMRIISTFFFLLVLTQTNAQTYSKVYLNEPNPIFAQAISETDANGIVIAAKQNEDGLIFSIDNFGDIIWQKTLFNSSTVFPKFDFYQVLPVADSNFVIAGRASSDTTQTIHSLIMKIDADGNQLWHRSFENEVLHPTTHTTVVETADSGYILVWGSVGFGQGFSVVRLDKDGNDVWSEAFNTSAPTTISDINRLNDSTYVMVGMKELTSAPYYDGVVLAMDDSGNLLWSKTYPAMLFDDLEIHNSKLISCGKNMNNSGSMFYTFGDLNGNFDMQYTVGWSQTTMLEEFCKITSLTDSTYFLYQPTDYWRGNGYEIDTSGTILQMLEADPRMRDLMKTSEEGVVLLGQGPLYGIKSIWPEHIGTVRLDSSLTVTDCGSNTSVTENSFSIASVDTLQWVAGTVPTATNLTITEGVVDLVDTMSCVQFIGSVQELSNQLEILVYPTVSGDLFTFETTDPEPYALQVISTTGQIVMTVENLHYTESISMKSNAAGIYYYKVIATDGREASGKIIVQH